MNRLVCFIGRLVEIVNGGNVDFYVDNGIETSGYTTKMRRDARPSRGRGTS